MLFSHGVIKKVDTSYFTACMRNCCLVQESLMNMLFCTLNSKMCSCLECCLGKSFFISIPTYLENLSACTCSKSLPNAMMFGTITCVSDSCYALFSLIVGRFQLAIEQFAESLLRFVDIGSFKTLIFTHTQAIRTYLSAMRKFYKEHCLIHFPILQFQVWVIVPSTYFHSTLQSPILKYLSYCNAATY